MSRSTFHPTSRLSTTLVLSLLLLGTLLPSGSANAIPVSACGVVQNAAGWPIAGATVTFTDLGTLASQQVVADADGKFTISLFRDFFYNVLVRASGTPDGATYATWSTLTDTTERFYLPADAAVLDCGRAVGPGGIVKLASPGQGFVDISVVDQAAAGAPALAARITTDLGHTAADKSNARFACVLGAPTTVTVDRASYLTAIRTPACSDTSPVVLTVPLWRQPIVVSVEVTSAATRAPAAANLAATTIERGINSATVTLARTAPGLAPLAANCGAADLDVGATKIDLLGGVSVDDASPYHCTATTDERGTATLALPWSGPNAGTYRLTASAAAHRALATDVELLPTDATRAANQPGLQDTVRAVGTPTVANKYARFSLLPTPPITGTLNVTVSATVTDAAGAGVPGVEVQFDGPTKTAVTTSASGGFTLSAQGGNYNITLLHPSYNVRTCVASLNHDNEHNVDRINTTTTGCFTLSGIDKAAISGTVTDALLGLPLRGASACWTPTSCALTDSNGHYATEVPVGATLTLSNGTPWESVTDTRAIQRGQALVFDGALARTTTSVTFVARDATTSAPIEGALVCVTGAAILAPDPCDGAIVTDADGKRVYTGVPWTRLPNGLYDAGAIQVTRAERHTTSYHYANGPTSAVVLSTDVDPTFPVPLAEETATLTAVTVRDAHTNAVIPAAITVAAIAPQFAVCGKECTGTSPASLLLYSSTSPVHEYVACATMDGYFASGPDGVCTEAFVPGSSNTIILDRTTNFVRLVAVDAHTGAPVEGAVASIVAGTAPFACDVDPASGPTYNCGGLVSSANGTFATRAMTASDTQGMPLPSVPWSTAGEMCFLVPAGSYKANLLWRNQGEAPMAAGRRISMDVHTQAETVAFQETRVCGIVPPVPGAVPTFTLRLAREPVVITGTVVDAATGAPMAGATVKPLSDRLLPGTPGADLEDGAAVSSFACDPQQTDSATRFPHCVGVTTDANGEYSLTLPATSPSQGAIPDDTWTLRVSAPGRFTERQALVKSGGAPLTVELWPKTFSATVTFRQDNSPTKCGGDFKGDINVTLTDAESSRSYLAKATRDGAQCTATFTAVEWNRTLTQKPSTDVATPAQVLSTGKTGNVFVVRTMYGELTDANFTIGEAVELLGPRDPAVSFVANRVNVTTGGQTGPYIRVGYILGRIIDDDARGQLNGVPGVLVAATRNGGPCLAGNQLFQSVSDARGLYAIPITCFGSFTVAPQIATPWKPLSPAIVGFASESDSPVRDFHAERKTSTLTVTVLDSGTLDGVAGVPVEVAGLTTWAHPDPILTDEDGTAEFELPWGTYTVTTTTTRGAAIPSAAVVLPSMDASATALIVAPAPGVALAGRVTDGDARGAGGLAGVLVTAKRVGGGCLGGQGDTYANLTDAAGAYSIVVPAACAGDFTIKAEHASSRAPASPSSRLYTAVADLPASFDGQAPVTGLDFVMRRTTGDLSITIRTNAATAATSLTPVGRDVAAEPGSRTTTFARNDLHWLAIPWGAYDVSGTSADGFLLYPMGAAIMPVLVAPGRDNAYVTVGVKPGA